MSETFKTEIELHKYDCLASHGKLDNYEFLLKKQEEFLNQKALPVPLINGKDLIQAGLNPSPDFKKILGRIYNMQLEGIISTRVEALSEAEKFKS